MSSEKKLKIGILGFGEVGQAVAKFYPSSPRLRRASKNPQIKDLNRNDGLKGVDILHICIPFNNNFVKVVKREIKEIGPKLTIVHSTVAPLTTKKIADSINSPQGGMIVHSPIRGIHPHLYSGIKTFVKYIGTDNKGAGILAKEHLESLGIKTKIVRPSVVTELGKLLSTSYYGLCIAWHGEMKEICDGFGVDFEKVVTDFNKTYNRGYRKLKKSNVIRPVLYPPEGPIGGHCIDPNTRILKRSFKSKALDLILKYEPKKKN